MGRPKFTSPDRQSVNLGQLPAQARVLEVELQSKAERVTNLTASEEDLQAKLGAKAEEVAAIAAELGKVGRQRNETGSALGVARAQKDAAERKLNEAVAELDRHRSTTRTQAEHIEALKAQLATSKAESGKLGQRVRTLWLPPV